MTTNQIKGKCAFITGGSKGIGLGIAHYLATHGVNIAITGRNQKTLDIAEKELISNYPNIEIQALVCDVRSLDDQKNVINNILSTWGKIDFIIANAGIGHFDSIENLSPQQWQETIDINLTGVFNTTKAGLGALKSSQGYLITIASLAGVNFFANGSAYNASKFGLVGFSQAIMLDLRKYNIKVSTIMPGSVSSHFNGHKPSENDAWKIQPEDIGKIVFDLITMHPRALPSKIEVRPSLPPSTK